MVYNSFTGEKPDSMGFFLLFLSIFNVNESIKKNSEQRQKPAEEIKKKMFLGLFTHLVYKSFSSVGQLRAARRGQKGER